MAEKSILEIAGAMQTTFNQIWEIATVKKKIHFVLISESMSAILTDFFCARVGILESDIVEIRYGGLYGWGNSDIVHWESGWKSVELLDIRK